jgi:type VI secretion system protein ImpK
METHSRRCNPIYNPILEVCSPILSLLLRIQEQEVPLDEKLYQEFVLALTLLEEQAHLHLLTTAEVTKIKFALIIFCDEVILHNRLSSHQQWPQYRLQYSLLGIDDGDALFFQHLDKLLKNSKHNINLLELYYLCLELGYQGNSMDNTQLLRLKVIINQEIIRVKGQPNRVVGQYCRDDYLALMTSKKTMSPASIMIIGIFLFMISFGAVEFFLREKIQQQQYYVKEQVQLLIDIVAEGAK